MNGELSMRNALVEEMRVVYGSDADIMCDDVSLTAGCNLSFVAVAMTLAEPGDEIILPVPWYAISPVHVTLSTHTPGISSAGTSIISEDS